MKRNAYALIAVLAFLLPGSLMAADRADRPVAQRKQCAQCHEMAAASFATTPHARTMRTPTDAELDRISGSLICSGYTPEYVLGAKNAYKYLVRRTIDGRDDLAVLPCEYDIATHTLAHKNLDTWKNRSYTRECAACHNGGFSNATMSFTRPVIECEHCHGPASDHDGYSTKGTMIDPAKVDARTEIDICASCHLQGGVSKTTGRKFPTDHKAGADIFADFTFDWAQLFTPVAKDETPVNVHQKILIYDVVVKHDDSLRCTSCHDLHAQSHAKHVKLARGPFCLNCHVNDATYTIKNYKEGCPVCES